MKNVAFSVSPYTLNGFDGYHPGIYFEYITPYTLDEFEDHLPGLYFEYIAQVYTKVDHWSLMIAIDLDRIRPD